jgi:hypothetical protein
VRNLSKAIVGTLLGAATAGGCSSDYGPRYVERVPVAGPGAPNTRPYEYDRVKPLPEPSGGVDRELPPESPFYDEPLVSQRTPEQTSFETAYRAVGRPRIVVFVNRSPEGEIRPAAGDGQVGSIDYTAMENILTDFLACQGAVEIVSPTAAARQRMTDAQARDAQSTRPQAMRDVAQQLDTDVLVSVTARPTRQAPEGMDVRLVGEAVNVKGGPQIGRAVVDIPPPLEKATLNRYTRFVARKLMMDMTQNWTSTEAPSSSSTTRPPAAPAPERPATPPGPGAK